MRGVLHIVATIIVIPYAVLAVGFLGLRYAIGDGSVFGFFERLLEEASWLVPWGVAGLVVGFLVLAALGLVRRLRGLGGLLLAVIALVSIVVIVGWRGSAVTTDEVVFLLPCVAALLFGGWVFAVERKQARGAKTAV